jgi:GT2 family glycosyltransferase
MLDKPARPIVSILMVNWNTRDMTLACLETVFADTRDLSFEVILVDNGSVDGSADAIRAAYPTVKLLAEPINHGFAEANNIAAKQAEGDYLLLLNTDTLIQRGALKNIVAFANTNPDARIWGGRTVFEDGTLNPMSVWAKITPWSAVSSALGLAKLFSQSSFFNPESFGGWQRDSVRAVDIVSGCFFLIERRLWEELNGFDPAFFMYGEEADLCARARAIGAYPMMTPDAQIVHFGGASSAKPTNKIIYIMGARIGLIQRQYTGLSQTIARTATVLGVFFRAKAFGIFESLSNREKIAVAAANWQTVWHQRARWKNGACATDIRSTGSST